MKAAFKAHLPCPFTLPTGIDRMTLLLSDITDLLP